MFFGTNMTGNPKIQWVQWSFSGEDCLLGPLGSLQETSLEVRAQGPHWQTH